MLDEASQRAAAEEGGIDAAVQASASTKQKAGKGKKAKQRVEIDDLK